MAFFRKALPQTRYTNLFPLPPHPLLYSLFSEAIQVAYSNPILKEHGSILLASETCLDTTQERQSSDDTTERDLSLRYQAAHAIRTGKG